MRKSTKHAMTLAAALLCAGPARAFWGDNGKDTGALAELGDLMPPSEPVFSNFGDDRKPRSNGAGEKELRRLPVGGEGTEAAAHGKFAVVSETVQPAGLRELGIALAVKLEIRDHSRRRLADKIGKWLRTPGEAAVVDSERIRLIVDIANESGAAVGPLRLALRLSCASDEVGCAWSEDFAVHNGGYQVSLGPGSAKRLDPGVVVAHELTTVPGYRSPVKVPIYATAEVYDGAGRLLGRVEKSGEMFLRP